MGIELLVLFTSILPATIRSACPVILAAVGEIHSQRSGVMNLGLEGMMMFGAFATFATVYSSGSILLGIFAGMAAGALLALIHAILVVRIGVDHIISGVMLGYLGIALADFFGRPYMGLQIPNLSTVYLGKLSTLPILGPLLFNHNILVYVSFLFVIISWVIFRYLRLGSTIIAVGDNPKASDAAGIDVFRIRIYSVVYGGMLAGLAGSYMTLNYASTFVSGITAGRGWIAIALVVFATWNPIRVVLGGLLFGGIESLQFHLSLMKVQIPYHFLMMMPYVVTIVVLIITGGGKSKKRPTTPQSIGITYKRE